MKINLYTYNIMGSSKHHKKHHHHSFFHKAGHALKKVGKVAEKGLDVADFAITAGEIVAPELAPELEKARTLEQKGKKVVERGHKVEKLKDQVEQKFKERRQLATQPISVPVARPAPQRPTGFGFGSGFHGIGGGGIGGF